MHRWTGHKRRRLDDPDDLIVLEIATALQRHIRVIPVLVEGVAPLQRGDLPQALAPLARRQAVQLDHATFNATVTTLLTALERALNTARTTPDYHSGGAVDKEHHAHAVCRHLNSPPWTTEDFTLLRDDSHPSSRRIVAILDELGVRVCPINGVTGVDG